MLPSSTVNSLSRISALLITGTLLFISFLSQATAAELPDLSGIYSDPKAKQYYDTYNKECAARGEKPFFTFATIDDLPKDLKWENGNDQSVFASPKAKRGGTFHYNIPSWPPTLRTVGPNANSNFRGYILDSNQIQLLQIHPNTDKYIPGIAREWALGNDHKTVYYRIDPDARFTDGQPISADDFFFVFYFMHSEWIIAPWYNNFYKTEFSNITKYDDYTISISTATPRADPIYYTAMEPQPRNFYKEFGPDFVQRYQQRSVPTSGPYIIYPEDVKVDQSITLSRIPNWWGDNKKYLRNRFNPDKIQFTLIREPNKIFEVFCQGDLDLNYLLMFAPKFWYDRTNIPAFKNGYICKATFYNQFPRQSIGIYINTAKPELSDLNVRIGIQHSINFNRVIQIFFRGDYSQLNGYNEGFGRFSNHDIKVRKYDPKLAREYFAQAGYTETDSDGILKKPDGTRLSFKLLARDNDVRKWMPIVVDSAQKCGLEIIPEFLDVTTNYRKLMEKKHDMAYTGWQLTGRYPRYWEGFHGVNAYNADGSIKTQTNNLFSYNREDVNELIDRFDRAESEDEVEKLSHQLLQIIHDDAIYVPSVSYDFYRVAYWRWIQFPEGFDVKASDDPVTAGLFWIDEDIKRETLETMKTGKTFPVVNEVYEQFREE